jgi:hypothetical protein
MDRVQNKPNSSVQHTPSSESFLFSLICDVHGYNDYLLGCVAIQSGISSRAFQRKILPPSSGSMSKSSKQPARSYLLHTFCCLPASRTLRFWRLKHYVPLKGQWTTGLHGVTLSEDVTSSVMFQFSTYFAFLSTLMPMLYTKSSYVYYIGIKTCYIVRSMLLYWYPKWILCSPFSALSILH